MAALALRGVLASGGECSGRPVEASAGYGIKSGQSCTPECEKAFAACLTHQGYQQCREELDTDSSELLSQHCMPCCRDTDAMSAFKTTLDSSGDEDDATYVSLEVEHGGGTRAKDTWLKRDTHEALCDLQRIDAANMQAEELAATVQALDSPALIVNALTSTWRALESWQDKTVFMQQQGQRDVPIVRSPLKTAIFGPSNRNERNHGEGDWDMNRVLGDDDRPLLVFDAGYTTTTEISSELGPSKLDAIGHNRVILSVGRPGGGLTLHKHGAAWLALIVGRKRWSLLHPDGLPKAAYRSVALKRPGNWSQTDQQRLRAGGLLTCEQQAGEVVYVPRLWWHATSNVGDCVGIGSQVEQIGDWQRESPNCAVYNHARGMMSGYHLERLWLISNAVHLDPFNVKYVHALAYEFMDRGILVPWPNATQLALELIERQVSLIEALWVDGHVSGADAAPLLEVHAMFLGLSNLQQPHPSVWHKPSPHGDYPNFIDPLSDGAFTEWKRHYKQANEVRERVETLVRKLCDDSLSQCVM